MADTVAAGETPPQEKKLAVEGDEEEEEFVILDDMRIYRDKDGELIKGRGFRPMPLAYYAKANRTDSACCANRYYSIDHRRKRHR